MNGYFEGSGRFGGYMPRWAIWLCTLAVIGFLALLAAFFREAGPTFGLGYIVGFLCCYCMFKCWRQDYEMESRPHFTD